MDYDPECLICGFTVYRDLLSSPSYDPRSTLATKLLELAIVAAQLTCRMPQTDAQPTADEFLDLRNELVRCGICPVQDSLQSVLDPDEASLAEDVDGPRTSSLVSRLQDPLTRALVPALVADQALVSRIGERVITTIAATADMRKPLIDALVPDLLPILVHSLVPPLVPELVPALISDLVPALAPPLVPALVPDIVPALISPLAMSLPAHFQPPTPQQRNAQVLRVWPCTEARIDVGTPTRSRSRSTSNPSMLKSTIPTKHVKMETEVDSMSIGDDTAL